jgi:hypothetical protein
LHSLKKSEVFQSFDIFSNINWRFKELHTPRSYLRQIYGAIYMVGLLCGSTIMGFISDKYGRVTGTFYLVIFDRERSICGPWIKNVAVQIPIKVNQSCAVIMESSNS